MWRFVQETGELFQDDNHRAFCYAGIGEGKNNPDMQSVHNTGPLPVGFYTIGAAETSPTKGPVMMRLTPDASNEMFGRGDFEIHGDSKLHPGEASNGCIVASRPTRESISTSGDNRLQVVARPV